MLGALHLNMAGVVKKLASTLAAGAPLASTPLRRRRQPHGRDVHRGRELNIRPPVLKFLDANAPSWWLSGQLWRSEDRTIKRIVLVGEKPSIARAWAGSSAQGCLRGT
ncbi:unnamed protein product [Symbiodinium sp. CCMP2592]|nr:unnamed protein product [Symbiodinium sp. CCMP2592]